MHEIVKKITINIFLKHLTTFVTYGIIMVEREDKEMTQMEELKKSTINNRIQSLKDMDTYIRKNIEDENNFYYWLGEGVPDACDEDMYMFIATDRESYLTVLEAFVLCTLNQDDEESEE